MRRLFWMGATLNVTTNVPVRDGQTEIKPKSRRRRWKQRLKCCDGTPKNASSPQRLNKAKEQTPTGTPRKSPPCWHLDPKPCKVQFRLLASGAMRTNLHCLTPLNLLKCYIIKGTNTVTKVTTFLRKWKVSIFPHRKKQTKKFYHFPLALSVVNSKQSENTPYFQFITISSTDFY